MRYTLLKFTMLFFFSVFFVAGSVFVMIPAKDMENTEASFFGYPIGFLVQDLPYEYKESRWHPPYWYFDVNRPFSLSWGRAIESVALVGASLWGCIWFLEWLNARTGYVSIWKWMKKKSLSLRGFLFKEDE